MSASKDKVTDTGSALVYLTECTLATVERMIYMKRKTKYEFERQQSIAQSGIEYIIRYACDIHKSSRVKYVIEKYKGNVADWVIDSLEGIKEDEK